MENSGNIPSPSTVQKVSEAGEKVSPIQLQTFAPFKATFYCTHCGFADTGKYCSSCGKSLSLAHDQFVDSLIQRFRALGFKSLTTDLQNEETEQSVRILNFRSLMQQGLYPFYNLGVGIIGMQPCMRLEIILLVKADEFNAEIDSVISDFLANCIGEESLREIDKLKKRDRIGNVSIKFVAADNRSSTVSSQNWRLKGAVPKRRKLPKFRRKRKYMLNTTTSAIHIDMSTQVVTKTSKMSFDPIFYEVSTALQQLKGQITIARKKNLGHVLFGEVIDYFNAFGAILSSPSVFAEAATRGGYITPSKIWSFYIIGILFPALLLYILSLGAIKPSQVLVFSGLPPILGEVAEGGVRVMFILVEVIIYYLTFRVFRRKGSFKKLFLAILLVSAFFTLISTTVLHGAQVLAIEIFSMDFADYLKDIETRISQGLSLVFLYMAYPFFVKLFRVGLRQIMVAFLIHGLLIYLPLQLLRLGLTY